MSKMFKEQGMKEKNRTSWYENPEAVSVNKRAPHSDIIPFENKENAISYQIEKKKTRSLNGEWKFSYFENPAQYENAFQKGLAQIFDTKEWSAIQVPGSWQLAGYDYPQYVNVKYPWELMEDIMPAQVPKKYNPIGIYSLDFDVKLEEGYLSFLRFEGIESCGEVYLNGRFTGYSEGSFTPAEYDVTEFLHEGVNHLVVKVDKWCVGSWLEDQDFFRLSGIFRDVNLYQLPRTYISDYCVTATLDDNYENGIFRLETQICGEENDEISLAAELYDNSKNLIYTNEGKVKDGRVVMETDIAKPFLWSAENPVLYTVVFYLKGTSQKEVLACRTGFRRFEMKSGLMMLNNKRIIFKGVNRHEFDPVLGRSITKDIMRRDIITIKRNNINAVRTSHYPNHPYWYELCDEYGIYLIDENNLETHGTWNYGIPEKDQPEALPGSKACWTKAVMERIKDMFYRDRNHPSVLIWSLGNESFCGENFRSMSGFLRENDSSRLVHYEGYVNCPGYEDVSDMESSMYSSAKELEEYGKGNSPKPRIICEYAHAMGNSCGSLFKYTKVFEQYDKVQGGFIWDYVDQAIVTTDTQGVEYLGYGGDFGDSYNDSNFCGNGLVFADRQESSKLFEVKVCYQNIDFEIKDFRKGILKIKNKNLFVNLSEYKFCWSLYLGEEQVETGEFLVEVEPGQTVEKEVPISLNEADGEWFLNIKAVLKSDTSWAPQGHPVAQGQFSFGNPLKNPKEVDEKNVSPLQIVETYGCLKIIGEDFTYGFSKRTGEFYSLLFNGEEYLQAPLSCNCWRASTDNDRGSKQSYRAMVWRYAGANASRWLGQSIIRKDGSVKISLTFILATTVETTIQTDMIIGKTGEIHFDVTYKGNKSLPDVPEIGLMFVLPKEFDQFNWHGRGQHENYIDRKESAYVGTYQSKVKDRMVPYLIPQECGNMTDVRRLTLTTDSGKSLTFVGEPFFESNVLPYTPEEVEAARHQKDLQESDKTVVRVNYKQTGVGGDDTWSQNARAHEEYRIGADNTYHFSFRLLPPCRIPSVITAVSQESMKENIYNENI